MHKFSPNSFQHVLIVVAACSTFYERYDLWDMQMPQPCVPVILVPTTAQKRGTGKGTQHTKRKADNAGRRDSEETTSEGATKGDGALLYTRP